MKKQKPMSDLIFINKMVNDPFCVFYVHINKMATTQFWSTCHNSFMYVFEI